MREEDLIFEQIREFSPQWRVSYEGCEIAVVTERYIAKPAFEIRFTDDTSLFCNTRDEVYRGVTKWLTYTW